MAHAIKCHQNGDNDQANQLYQKILSTDPQNVDALHYSGVIAMQAGKIDRAIQLIEKAIAIRPDISGFHSNLAMAYKENNQFQPSLDHYNKALSLKPKDPVILFNLGALHQAFSKYENAQTLYEESYRIDPNQPLVLHNLGNLLLKQGDVQNAIQSARKAMALAPNNPKIQSNYFFSLNYSIDHSPETIINEHLKWGQQNTRTHSKKPCFQHRPRIHIGYVSPDFRQHSVSKFIQAILMHHDKKYFEIYCYSNVKKPDHETNALKQSGVHWRDIYFLNDHKVYEQIQADGIHILVDLAGHSSGNRLMVFARKPAPIQVTYLGYPNTTGLSQIEYRLVDQQSDPDLNRFSGSENRVYLPNGFLCYSPSENAPSITRKVSSKHTTFGSFNNLPKINHHVIALWANVLKAVPDSRLLLKTNGFKVSRIQEKYWSLFQKQGIDPSRIELRATVKEENEHLALYNEMDIALDTFPYNGTTTTCEALWMGVPVITLSGHHHAARVGASILKQTVLNQWIAHGKNDYIKKAKYLADHPEDRVYFKQNLRGWLSKSLLCQKEYFVKTLENVFCQLVRQYIHTLT